MDEVGRGSLAGAVVAAAYRFHRSGTTVPGLDDSKKLSLKKREELFTLLTQPEIGTWAVGEATIEEIEEHNILVASQMAMGRALDKLGFTDGVILVDGLPAKHLGREHIAVVGGGWDLPLDCSRIYFRKSFAGPQLSALWAVISYLWIY